MTDRCSELMKWFEKALEEGLRPRCPSCGAKLEHYWYYGYHGVQYQTCEKCGNVVERKYD